MIHHQLMGLTIASHHKCLKLNLRNLRSQRACTYRISWLCLQITQV